jgi:hypothetical protein
MVWRVRRAGAAVVMAGAMGMALLSGCGGATPSSEAQPPKAQSPETQVCQSLNALQTVASEMGALSLSTSRAEVQQSVDGLLIAVGNVADDVSGALGSDIEALQRQLQNLSADLGSLPDGASVADAVAVVQRALPGLQAALGQFLDGADCDGAAAPG